MKIKNSKIRNNTMKSIRVSDNIKKMILVFIAVILNFLGVANSVYATSINSAHIYAVNDCGKLLTYKGIPVKVTYIEYNENGVHYPAYCLDKTKPGAEEGEYSVSVNSAINDIKLWRRIINGYPYKTIEQLGVANKEEAFTATKQAIYCYIHGNNPNDYGGIGEAGNRTLNAMKNIIENAEKSSENKISSTISINKDDKEWKQDKNSKEYVSKTYSVSAGAKISNYNIKITKENAQNIGGIKLTDENNKEKSEFLPNEKFKILIPVKELKDNGQININVEAQVETKPVLYGTAPDSNHQDYALTAATFEDGKGNINDKFYKNETKIVIIKQDQETGERLSNVEFQLLDKDKNIVYSDLKTDNNGKIVIENIIPGEYYLKEVKTIDGYMLYEQLINIKVGLNEELTITVNNSKEETPKIETETKNNKEISNKALKKLPVTGM